MLGRLELHFWPRFGLKGLYLTLPQGSYNFPLYTFSSRKGVSAVWEHSHFPSPLGPRRGHSTNMAPKGACLYLDTWRLSDSLGDL